MDQLTHRRVDRRLSGTPVHLAPGLARVELTTTEEMVADDTGLIHGGFIFGLADLAAVLAVNHPNVVVGSAEVRFMKPVVLGDRLVAEARLIEEQEVKKLVEVQIRVAEVAVFRGEFICFTPDRHVLASH